MTIPAERFSEIRDALRNLSKAESMDVTAKIFRRSGEEIWVGVAEFNGEAYAYARIFCDVSGPGWLPTKRGIVVKLDRLGDLQALADELAAAIDSPRDGERSTGVTEPLVDKSLRGTAAPGQVAFLQRVQQLARRLSGRVRSSADRAAEDPSEIANRCGIGSLAFYLPGSLQRAALSLSASVTLFEVEEYLEGSELIPHKLGSPFNTERRRNALRDGFEDFSDTVRRWDADQRWDERVSWVVPDPRLRMPSSSGLPPADLRALVSQADGELATELTEKDDASVWLPLLSLELINELRNLRIEQRTSLIRALSRGCRALDAPPVRPWSSEFDRRLLSLPLAWLFQFEPRSRMERLLSQLIAIHCTNVGHLVAFHPGAWELARKYSSTEWIRLRLALTRHLP